MGPTPGRDGSARRGHGGKRPPSIFEVGIQIFAVKLFGPLRSILRAINWSTRRPTAETTERREMMRNIVGRMMMKMNHKEHL
jgi:hypothetical protein